jgi:hypothetical protein
MKKLEATGKLPLLFLKLLSLWNWITSLIMRSKNYQEDSFKGLQSFLLWLKVPILTWLTSLQPILIVNSVSSAPECWRDSFLTTKRLPLSSNTTSLWRHTWLTKLLSMRDSQELSALPTRPKVSLTVWTSS